ncbi:MAG TPA: 6-phosphogluconolactonase [Gaiellaceae bacterium]|nr:6-phosphogluconolactonase [Gaiellaceae bacterium]
MASEIEILVVDDPAQVVAERLAAAARAGGHVALTGGSTPRVAYEQAAALESDWSRVELWWGDERCVPPDDDNSNYGMAKHALLDRVSTGAVHRMRGELGREQGAELYEQELGSLERFDLLLLGLGPDGHVASLFPEQPTLDETERRVVGSEAKLEPFVDRITLTLPMLRGANEVLFLVAGEDKADAAKRAFAGEPSRSTPGSLVRATHGTTTAVLDAAAARYL